MRFLIFVFILFITGSSSKIQAQSSPTFTKFEGDVYALNSKKVIKGYGDHVYEGEKITSISWDEINVSNRSIDEAFPDVDRKKMFGMVLYSTMAISEDACYDFILDTDDGSKLWIESQLILDNDKGHKMKLVSEKLGLLPGKYEVKIWYHQAYPTNYGFIFDAKQTNGPCPKFKVEKPELPNSIKFTLNEDVSFAKDEFIIKDSAKPRLDSIAQLISANNPKKVNIVGHTDNTGSDEYNKNLSKKRALAIQGYLMKTLSIQTVYAIRAMGENFPIGDNATAQGRSKNRRVEIILIQ